ncbi:cyclohexa-1,5-dienecarbonyl-CoA hydratase [Inmirania thermothiophila]|uniref:Cyclohexa-1,5-diene-1-carbonyl-CoA hydratase n=1 Tax=Inmirania thermothiophila TaxID=1750597 RepID=A0A3N1Y4G2_9GAMM|nr:cyclohexa-1,5-dienecarbonyl-CoA hydratase [Inmirania thermothiophila]ROR32482.1 cyclohexa-1,5-diene-1-carbonyl-CoA hydratase [Inmirania thermothiophila]
MSEPLKVWEERDGQLLRLRLARPKANIVDAAMIAALAEAFAGAGGEAARKAVLLDHEGPHFSFGASVEEHLPGQCAEMLAGLHALIRRMLDCPLPILVAIRGQCLGGGLEVAAAGDLLFAAPDARLGQPEMQLAVFAPAGSCLLPEKVGPGRAFDMLVSGRSLSGEEAAAAGLVQEVAEDPEAAALAWFDRHLAPKSAAALRYAVQAARMQTVERIKEKLERVERLYLDGLMSTHDAVEGLRAFLEKRPAQWENR